MNNLTLFPRRRPYFLGFPQHMAAAEQSRARKEADSASNETTFLDSAPGATYGGFPSACRWWWGAWCIALMVGQMGGQASGHSMVIHRGQVALAPGRATVRIELSTHELTHLSDVLARPSKDDSPTAGVCQAYRRHLANSLVIRDSRGRRIPVCPAGHKHVHTAIKSSAPAQTGCNIELDYRWDSQTSLLVFQYSSAGAVPGSLPGLVLDVRGDGQSAGRTVRLQNGQYPQYVELQRHGDRVLAVSVQLAQDCAPFAERGYERFNTPLIDLKIDPSELVAHVYIPTGLLATWTPVQQSASDVLTLFLTPQEQAGLVRQACELFEHAATVNVSGRTVSPTQVSARMRAFVPDDVPPEGTEGNRGIWTTYVEVQLRYPLPADATVIGDAAAIGDAAGIAEARVITWRWDLFNAMVNSFALIAHTPTSCLEDRLSSYAPVIDFRFQAGQYAVTRPLFDK